MNAEAGQQADELLNRLAPQLPDAPAGTQAVALPQLHQLEIGLLQEQRGAGRGAAASDEPAFEQRCGHPRRCEQICDERSGHAAAHDGDAGLVTAGQRRISLLGSCSVRKPQRSSETQPSLRACSTTALG